MAHHVEPMDIDSDFDNKENSLHHNNVLPFTEKGYEELDVSELNMKLRYSITPISSPMSKSYTANCLDNRSQESGDELPNVSVNDNTNLTRSLNSTLTKNDNVLKSLKVLPLQALSTEQFVDNDRSTSVLRPLDSTITQDSANIKVTVSGPSNIDENLSLLSSSSSAVQTPEATTPTKDIPKNDGGSPIMRGLKSVLNMFRSSQSPIPPPDIEDNLKQDVLSPAEPLSATGDAKSQALLASTPISAHRKKEVSPTKRSSPHKDSLVFNEDLEKELLWKDETTILFSQERIPIHKLFFQQPQNEDRNITQNVEPPKLDQDDLNSTVEYMDISYNDSIRDRTMTDTQVMGNRSACTIAGESDGEFVDCETTFTKNESFIDEKDKTPIIDNTLNLDLTKDTEPANVNTSASRLKKIVLNTTQDILDATLSITPEDLLPEALEETKALSEQKCLPESTKANSNNEPEKNNCTIDTVISVVNQENSVQLIDHSKLHMQYDTIDVSGPSAAEEPIEESNVTKTIENDIVPVFNQTVDIKNYPTNEEYEKDLDHSNSKENISIQLGKQGDLENLNLTSNNETFVHDDKTFEHGDFNATHLVGDISSNTAENSLPVICTSEKVEQAIGSKTLTIPDHEVNESLEGSSMTKLPTDIPLPDEDDLEKELDIPVDTKTEPINLSLDLVDDIKVKSDISEMIHNLTIEEPKTALDNYEMDECKVVSPKNTSPISTRNFERGDNVQNQLVLLNAQKMDTVPKVLECADVNYENVMFPVDIPKEPQIETIDVLTEVPPIVNVEPKPEENVNVLHEEPQFILGSDTQNKTDQVPYTESLNAPLTQDIGAASMQIALVAPMNINESIIETKPLPDIINQTISMPNVDILESAANLSGPVIEQQPITLPDATENDNDNFHPEIVHEVITEVVPELSPDSNVVEIDNPATEIINVLKVELPTTLAIDMASNSVTNVMENLTDEGSCDITEMTLNHEMNSEDIIPADALMLKNEKQTPNADSLLTSENIKNEDREIILSENNSPFVLVTADDIPEIKADEAGDVQHFDDQSALTGKVVCTPPVSPPITSRGYNFNFDEIDDPFATKTKIRLSPPMDTPNKVGEPELNSRSVEKPVPKKEANNRYKSQSERKRPVASKRKFNSYFSNAHSEKSSEKPVEKLTAGDINLELPINIALDPKNVTINETKMANETTVGVDNEVLKSREEVIKLENNMEQPIKTAVINVVDSDKITSHKTTSSSEQSMYYSAGTSSNESILSRNVFNLPEIDDINFNPFATKSKMRESPPPTLDIENPFVSRSNIINTSESSIITENDRDVTKPVSPHDKMETELMEKDALGNLSCTTNSSKATDERNATVREINTEDEDTIEGPFLEAEDLNTDDKMSDFDGDNIDMMQFGDFPTQGTEDNADNGELFIDAEAFEFLLNQNKCNSVVDSGKESLFLKFDPLFAKRMSSVKSDGVVASLNNMQNKQSTPTKAVTTPQQEVISPIAGPSNLNATVDMNVSEEFNDDLNVTVSKPMMVVPPAVNPVTPRNKSLTPNRSNRRSITFTSPAMAVIDRLLSLSGNTSLLHDATVTQTTREQNEADLALTQLRELLAEKEIHVYTLRSESHELKDRLTTLESHLRNLEAESQDRLQKINNLNDQLAEKTKINKSMAAVVEEYERTIASLISETAQDKKRHTEERIKLINERDEQTAHLASMEVSFSDLHSKYEKSKQVILNCKANEDAYKKSIKEFEENLKKMQNNYELLKQHATSKLNHANQELEKMNKTHEAEVLKLNAMIKRKELHITSLEESLAQKMKANEELTAICDELINKVG